MLEGCRHFQSSGHAKNPAIAWSSEGLSLCWWQCYSHSAQGWPWLRLQQPSLPGFPAWSSSPLPSILWTTQCTPVNSKLRQSPLLSLENHGRSWPDDHQCHFLFSWAHKTTSLSLPCSYVSGVLAKGAVIEPFELSPYSLFPFRGDFRSYVAKKRASQDGRSYVPKSLCGEETPQTASNHEINLSLFHHQSPRVV